MVQSWITVVSGLPRSGTSMLMQMLEAGGMQIFTDNARLADEDNPKGYYELEPVKHLEEDASFLDKVQGRACKIISERLKHLPAQYDYRVIFIRRKMEEILASQKQMLMRRGEHVDRIGDQALGGIFQRHLAKIEHWLAQQPNCDVLYINYNELVNDPAEGIKKINRFLDDSLDLDRMAEAVDKTLYRQRR